jgi:hypothetical protein
MEHEATNPIERERIVLCALSPSVLREMAEERAKTTSVSNITLHPSTDSICHIQKLPNELLSYIFDHLDSHKPSDLLKDEPTFDISNSPSADLKSVSRVTHQWRNLSIPVLFKHARLVVSDPKTQRPILNKYVVPFLEFVKSYSLQKVVNSFTLIVRDRKLAIVADFEYRLTNFRPFWNSLFRVIDPLELLIVAHPAALGPLTSCHVSLTDAWNFDCPCHYFRLQRPSTPGGIINIRSTRRQQDTTATNSPDSEGPDPFQHSSTVVFDNINRRLTASELQLTSDTWGSTRGQSSAVFDIRPWTSFLLNEGSFIRSYATYEFWLRQPPSVGVGSVSRIVNANT